ncbi:MAG TPA: redoxin domain-containing protein [Gemmatimonadaceae bacterium]|nr:redoxin domain-containing protein [Gemmatimonadaceae bacterium]
MSITDAATRPPMAGEPAPDLSLPATDGSTVTLSALRGRETVLLAFFPLAFTSTCTAELCAFTEDYDAFAAKGVRVLPISVDSVATLREYKAKYGLRAELLSDFHREASRAYGVLIPERFYSNRAYFLVDPQGVVRWSHVEANPSARRENAEILAAIDRLA